MPPTLLRGMRGTHWHHATVWKRVKDGKCPFLAKYAQACRSSGRAHRHAAQTLLHVVHFTTWQKFPRTVPRGNFAGHEGARVGRQEATEQWDRYLKPPARSPTRGPFTELN
jgi:hypothetical protein